MNTRPATRTYEDTSSCTLALAVNTFQEGSGDFNLGPVQELRIRKPIIGTVSDRPGPKTPGH